MKLILKISKIIKMSWKPSRSSGIMFDKYTLKAAKNRSLIGEMLESGEYLHYYNLNKFSKIVYLYWLNENKAMQTMGGKSESYSFRSCCQFECIYQMFIRNKERLYKPMQKLF
jgi:hypothetical protein